MSESHFISRRVFAQRVLSGVPSIFVGARAVFGQDAPSGGRSHGPRATEPQEIGPYHRDGAPMGTSLCTPGTPGRPLSVAGRVLAEESGAPLTDVLLDVWQADSIGKYDFQDEPPPKTPAEYRMRALMLTDGAGRYTFRTVLPGNYKTSPTFTRPKHIHYLIRRTGYEPLITQLYFEGDPFNEKDSMVRRSLIMPLRDRSGGEAGVTFDIVLQRERIPDATALKSFGDYIGEYLIDGTSNTPRVEWRGGRLVSVLGKDSVHELRYRGGTRFFDPESAAQVTFVRDEHGQVASLLVDLVSGQQVKAKKVR